MAVIPHFLGENVIPDLIFFIYRLVIMAKFFSFFFVLERKEVDIEIVVRRSAVRQVEM
jgi:hypothetical protein